MSDEKKQERTCGWWARRVVLSSYFQIFMFLVLVVDAGAFVLEIVYDWHEDSDGAPQAIFLVSYIMLLCYCVEVALGMYGFGCRNFGRDFWNILDVVVLTAALVLTYMDTSSSSVVFVRALKFSKHAKLLKILGRALRCIHVVQRTQQRSQAMRTIVSKNKFRYLDLRNNFDLDLTYITGNLIAMGVPVSGCISPMYRNPIWDVARFFQHCHSGHFRIYNICPELPYSDERFTKIGGSVVRFEVEDHTPPRMDQFLEFLRDAREFRRQDYSNMLAVHCKAGKGRTGSFCCAWLLYSTRCRGADQALEWFSRRRTDQRLRGKGRGVETPSQVRYVRQLALHLERHDSWFNSTEPPPAVPTPALRLQQLELGPGFLAKPRLLRSLQVLIQWYDPISGTDYAEETGSCAPTADGSQAVIVDLGALAVRSDVRISVFAQESKGSKDSFSAKASMLAVRNPFKAKGLLAFFTFHTGFVEMLEREQEDGCCHVPVEDMDKAAKRIKAGVIGPGTCVKLRFSRDCADCNFQTA